MDKPIHIDRFPKFIIRHINKCKIKTSQDLLYGEDNLNLRYINLSTWLETSVPTITALEIEAVESELTDSNFRNVLLPGKIIEVVSLPKINNTEFCINLASWLLQNNPDRHVIYITDSHFLKDKLYYDKYFSNDEKLDRIHVCCFQSYFELTQFVTYLNDFIANTGAVCICIIDPLVPFLKPLGFSARISAYKLLRDLKRLGFSNSFPIVIMNNFTTKVCKGETELVPALNSTLSHRVDAKFIIEDCQGYSWTLFTMKL